MTTLAEYSKELGLDETMTIDRLISSHRDIHKSHKATNKEWATILEDARRIGKKQGLEQVTNGEYIEVSKLKTMTIAELVEFIGFDD